MNESLAATSDGGLPAWVLMWMGACALFFAAKCVTLVRLSGVDLRANAPRLFAYLLLWPGLDAREFCRDLPHSPPGRKELIGAAINVTAGILLMIGAIALADTHLWYFAGWLGMVSVVLLLHFGCFNLLSIFWRARGVDAQPIMRSPLGAPTLSKLWSGSWNTAFTDLMHAHVFKPTVKRFGPIVATTTVFALSGALHELVISVPARAGYGLPTAYFMLQCAGVLLEKSAMGRRVGLNRGFTGRLFAFAIAGGPIFILFPQAFIANVVIPMLNAIERAVL